MLITRLSCVDVTGLGISPLIGKMLVQYAGSLTSCDFHAIAQVAPYMLYDLAPTECFQAWLALCHLIPMIRQPEIMDVHSYIVSMNLVLELAVLIPYSGGA